MEVRMCQKLFGKNLYCFWPLDINLDGFWNVLKQCNFWLYATVLHVLIYIYIYGLISKKAPQCLWESSPWGPTIAFMPGELSVWGQNFCKQLPCHWGQSPHHRNGFVKFRAETWIQKSWSFWSCLFEFFVTFVNPAAHRCISSIFKTTEAQATGDEASLEQVLKRTMMSTCLEQGWFATWRVNCSLLGHWKSWPLSSKIAHLNIYGLIHTKCFLGYHLMDNRQEMCAPCLGGKAKRLCLSAYRKYARYEKLTCHCQSANQSESNIMRSIKSTKLFKTSETGGLS